MSKLAKMIKLDEVYQKGPKWNKMDQNSNFQVEIFSRDRGSLVFAFWLIPGECFAPLNET